MQFDHIDGNKNGEVGRMAHDGGRLMMKKEMEKCELVCANCHAERTHGRMM